MKRTVTSIVFFLAALVGVQQSFAQKASSQSYAYLKSHGLLDGYTNNQLIAMQSYDALHPIAVAPVRSNNPVPVIQSQVLVAGPDTTICGGSVTLNATLLSAVPTNISLFDDEWSNVINLPFSFTFYGTSYNQILIGSNDVIKFGTTASLTPLVNQYCTWPISAAVPTPNPADMENTVMGPWQDINPGVGGTIGYATVGTSPNRIFVVEYCDVPMFSCTADLYTTQIQLYEGSNVIETHILNKPLCATWNGGAAIHATQNATGTIANVVPGRNFPSQWTAMNDGKQFTPNGPNAYTIAPIAFNPVLLSSATISWYLNGNLIGTGNTITVTPSVTSDYIAQASGSCGNYVYSDTATVTIGGNLGTVTIVPASATVCAGGSVQLTASATGATSYSWSPATDLNNANIANPVSTPSATTTYTVTASNANGCSSTATVTVNVGGQGPVVSVAATGGSCNAGVILVGWTGTPVTISATAPGAVSYVWSPNGETTQSIDVTSGGIYCVTAADANGCTGSSCDTVPTGVNVACGHNGDKVILCHVPPGNPGNPVTICIAASAIPNHLANHPGDCVGPCSLYYAPRYSEILNTIDEKGFFAEAYPNPFTNSFQLHMIIAPDVPVTVNVHDVTGRLIENYTDVTEQTQIGSKLAKGVYTIDVIQGADHQMLHLVKSN
jgi:hypothetical protein